MATTWNDWHARASLTHAMANAHPGRERDVLAKLREVIAGVAEDPDPSRLVAGILDRAITLVGGERGFVITLAAGPTSRFEIAAARHIERGDITRPEFQVSRSVV